MQTSPLHYFDMSKWVGGINTSQDPSAIAPNELTEADNVTFAERGSRLKRDGIDFNWDSATDSVNSIIGAHDFWFGNTTDKTQRKISVTDDKKIYSYNTSGTRSSNLFAGAAWSSTVTTAAMSTLNNLCIISVDGSGNVMKKWDGAAAAVSDLGVNTTTAQLNFCSTTGNITSGSNQLTSLASTSGIIGGSAITGTGIPANTTVLSIASTTVTMSANATATTSSLAVTFQSMVLTNVASTFYASLGASITGTGIPANTTITFVTPNTNTVTISANPTVFGASTTVTITQTVPLASVTSTHLSRVWGNDKTNPDRLNYSTTGNTDEWFGRGDSGGLNVGTGDGDPKGITAIFPTFQGVLFVAKSNKLYRVDGSTPETFIVTLVSSGIGCVSHNSIAPIDQDDMYFVSNRGVHSLETTSQFGDFSSQFLSESIQRTFRDKFVKSRLPYTWGAYLSSINSYALAVTDGLTSSNQNQSIWIYNIPLKSWYRWPNVSCQSMIVADDSDKRRLYFGGANGRLAKSFNNTNFDVNSTGSNVSIPYVITTGQVFVDGIPYTEKAFKNFALLFRPTGSYSITVTLTIDNYPAQSLNYSSLGSTDLLGSTFILGSSVLGYTVVTAPYAFTIDGYGRSIQVKIQNNSIDDSVEIFGFVVGWEQLGFKAEVITSIGSD